MTKSFDLSPWGYGVGRLSLQPSPDGTQLLFSWASVVGRLACTEGP